MLACALMSFKLYSPAVVDINIVFAHGAIAKNIPSLYLLFVLRNQIVNMMKHSL